MKIKFLSLGINRIERSTNWELGLYVVLSEKYSNSKFNTRKGDPKFHKHSFTFLG